MQDQYLTISDPVTGYFMNSGSKFYAYAYPILNEAEAVTLLQLLKKEHPKARHYCTAMRLLPDGSLSRSSDDGEPVGSAGKPMLNQLMSYNLTYVYAVVVRYFGGTKLGIPGLIEAYKVSTADALAKATIITRTIFTKARIILPFDSYPGFLNFLMQRNVPVLESEFDEHASLTIAFPASVVKEDLMKLLREYAQLDFSNITDYALQLGWKIDVLHESFTQ